MIGSGPKAGEQFDVTVPTFVATTIDFESGQVGQLLLTFDSHIKRTQFEVDGPDGALSIPDPDMFGGDVGVHTSEVSTSLLPVSLTMGEAVASSNSSRQSPQTGQSGPAAHRLTTSSTS